MTFPDHKSLDELKQQALFEVVGALDEPEVAQFDRDFKEVTASVQADLRRIQAEAVVDLALLGTEDPTASLKSRSMAAMMTAMDAHESGLAPIAHIGSAPARRPGRTPVRSIDATELMEQAMATATARSDAARFARTAYWWRAAAIGLVAALVVTIYFERQANWWGQRVGEGAMQRLARQDMLRMLNQPGLTEMLERADVVRGLRAVASDGKGSATVLVDSQTARATLLTLGLTPGETYTLRVTREDGRKEAIGTITPMESLAAVAVLADDAMSALAMNQIELVDSRGRVVLST
jgi:hypothetical protein